MTPGKPVTVWRYYVPSHRHQGWGIFLLTSDGMLAVVSDYGNYAFRWSAFGEGDFRHFVMKLREDYLLGKLCPHEYHYDRAATELGIKRHILELRRAKIIGKAWARDEWEHLAYLDEGFERWLERTAFGEAWEDMIKDYSAQARGFYREVFTRLVPLLAADLVAADLAAERPKVAHG